MQELRSLHLSTETQSSLSVVCFHTLDSSGRKLLIGLQSGAKGSEEEDGSTTNMDFYEVASSEVDLQHHLESPGGESFPPQSFSLRGHIWLSNQS